MAVPAQGHVLKLEKENVLPCALSTVRKQPLYDKNGHWVQHGWLYSSQSDSLLAYSGVQKHVAANQIAWVRSIPSFRPCIKNWSSNEQNTVQGRYGTPSYQLGGWGYGGVRYSENHKLSPYAWLTCPLSSVLATESLFKEIGMCA